MDLIFISYETGSLYPVESHERPPDIEVDNQNGLWYWQAPNGRQGPFRIGRDVRTPESHEDREFFGPMMVLNGQDQAHFATYQAAVREIFRRPPIAAS